MFQPFLSDIYRQSGLKLMVAAIKRFTLLGHKTHAAALTYTTLFALVPLLTVMYSVLSMIPALQESRGEIEDMLLGNLIPASGDALMGYLYQFSEQARKLTTIGIALLIVTAFLMLKNIEHSFNQVWLLEKGRKGLSSFLLYWAILSLGPLMLSAGIAVSSYVSSLSMWKEGWVPSSGVLALGIVVPYITSFLFFTLIYWAVPNCKVLLKHAAVGGALVAFLFEMGKIIFAEATTFFPSYQLIYGAFAAVPLFLLWLFVTWSVILFGAEIVFLLGENNDNFSIKKFVRKNSALVNQSPADQPSFGQRGLVQKSVDQNSLDPSSIDSGSIERQETEPTSPLFNFQEQGIVLAIINIMEQKQISGEGGGINQILSLVNRDINSEVIPDQLEALLEKLVDQKILILQPSGEYFLIRNLEKYSLIEFIRC